MNLPHAFNAHVQPPVWDWISLYQEHSPAPARDRDSASGAPSVGGSDADRISASGASGVGGSDADRDFVMGIQSSFTVDFLQQVIAAKLLFYGRKNPHVHAGGFNQFRQELMRADSDYYRMNPQATALILDPVNLSRALESGDLMKIVKTHVAVLPESLLVISNAFKSSEYPVPVHEVNGKIQALVGSAPRPPESAAPQVQTSPTSAGQYPQVRILDMESWVARWGSNRVVDPKHEFLAGMMIAPEMTPYLAEEILAFLYESLGLRKKCLVLDLDDTLWGGIVGEDGLAGIQLDVSPPGNVYRAIQEAALAFQKKGVMLAVASKNNPKDAMEVIEGHSHMILRREHFAAIEIGWHPKDEMLRNIAGKLNIGVDSLVFLDDNPNERELVRAMLPGVTVLDPPNDPAWWPRYLQGLRCFEASVVTAEDRGRAKMYEDEEKRKNLRKSSGSIEDYLRTLETKAAIGYLKSVDDENLPRVAQLSQRTNQFNLNPTQRYTEGHLIPREITAQTEDQHAFRRVFWMKVSDRLGDSGLVGGMFVIVVRDRMTEPLVANIHNFFMSCRVIGRQVERAFVHEVLTYLKSKGVGKVRAVYVPGEKNMQTRDFYKTVGFQSDEERRENHKEVFGVELYDTQGVIKYELSLENYAPEATPYIRVEWKA